ncbi:rod shape-determining protein MreD [Paenirhodobacter sp.]|uniref:rod shape-determining protein MreD n=1 Tax=Paenirhodobacter sp. TaxID=1965326 RepID=UPI003B3D4F47
MVDPLSSRRIAHMALFALIAAGTMFLRLLPISPVTHGVPGPDLMLAFAVAWLLRRPDYVPTVLIIAVFVLEDLIYWRPIGLWPLIVLGGTEFLRSRVRPNRSLSFPAELAIVAGVMLVMLLVNRLVLALFMVDQPVLGLELLRYLMTLVAYPFVVALSALAFGLRRPAPGDDIAFGRRL